MYKKSFCHHFEQFHEIMQLCTPTIFTVYKSNLIIADIIIKKDKTTFIMKIKNYEKKIIILHVVIIKFEIFPKNCA